VASTLLGAGLLLQGVHQRLCRNFGASGGAVAEEPRVSVDTRMFDQALTTEPYSSTSGLRQTVHFDHGLVSIDAVLPQIDEQTQFDHPSRLHLDR
jgi:hypothetical protein